MDAPSVSPEIGRSVVDMKVLMKPIEMIALFSADKPRPIKFKIDDNVVKVEQIISLSEEKLAGNRMIIYRCQSEINGLLKQFELKYEILTFNYTKKRDSSHSSL